MRESELSFPTPALDKDTWYLWNFFIDRFVCAEWRATTREEWTTEHFASPEVLAKLCGDTYTSVTKTKSVEVCGELDDENYMHIQCYQFNVSVTIAQPRLDQEAVTKWMTQIKEFLPVAVPQDEKTIPIRFWMHSSSGGAISRQRMISVPIWDEIAGNYATETAGGLAGVMNGFKPSHGGQLVLWHGKPGTGKTFAIRALGQRWKDWCSIECIVDPESFFGSADYMMQVLMDTSSASPTDSDKEPWRLLVLEDAGELLQADARERTGQGLSRMLNLADGLIGQGLQTLMLVTTNEPLRSIHPAVSRPGRCAAEVEFLALSAEEAKVWLEKHGQENCGKSLTLADLYGRMSDFKGAEKQERRVGLGV